MKQFTLILEQNLKQVIPFILRDKAINRMKWVKDCNGVNVDIQVEEISLVTE